MLKSKCTLKHQEGQVGNLGAVNGPIPDLARKTRSDISIMLKSYLHNVKKCKHICKLNHQGWITGQAQLMGLFQI